MKRLILFLLSLTILTCAVSRTLTQEENSYLVKVKKFPLEFKMYKVERKEAMSRAKSFIERYSNMEIQLAGDFLIQTYDPPDMEYKFGYYVRITPIDIHMQVNVECLCGSWFFSGDAKKNTHFWLITLKQGNYLIPI